VASLADLLATAVGAGRIPGTVAYSDPGFIVLGELVAVTALPS
jgi:hypothetical protein